MQWLNGVKGDKVTVTEVRDSQPWQGCATDLSQTVRDESEVTKALLTTSMRQKPSLAL